MVFGEILAEVRGKRRRVVFYNVDTQSDYCDRIIDYVGVHDVLIKYTTDERFPESTVAVQNGEEVLSVDSIETVANYLNAWESELTAVDEQPSLFGALDETVFRSSNRRQLLLASRLIETRAATVGDGRLAAGFQQLSLAEPQLSFYEALPSAVTVSLYGEPDWVPPADSGIEAYDPDVESNTDYWWVIFDGTAENSSHAALLAEEQSPGDYTGFWTYRPSIIDAMRAVVDGFDARRLTPTN
ncbi:hypothetical protein halTADL_2770 [Halohasta litchfieldiae]|jgi:hypothetical protein|uniref:Diguanylate Cyclase and Two-component system sensory domain-containing protein n=1 Tax=Halohasta litchfieldiae TaxID=1073996 RepID=A0A1H6UYF2_9EURY|nr:hypothetical protein [Halohasta litchfieldiae]ATW89486.1 hypothetical protein halTADL_2770 [Halohasta litchfieldiae]SEI93410.1 hypothetical protein SAMN05444271_11266 [Halohasta litchfieldiae]